MVDVQALCGDSVDNVPGAPGIGIKTAAQLINEYGDLDTLLARAGEIKQPKRRETLIEFADQIRLSRELVQLDCDTPLPEPIDDLAVDEPDGRTLAAFLETMEFRTLARRVADGNARRPQAGAGVTPTAPAPAPWRAAAGQSDAEPIDDQRLRLRPRPRDPGRLDRQRLRGRGSSPSTPRPTPSSSATAGLCGVSLAIAPGEACYIPRRPRARQRAAWPLEATADLEPDPAATQALRRLKPLLEDPAVLKVAQNAKYDIAVLAALRRSRWRRSTTPC